MATQMDATTLNPPASPPPRSGDRFPVVRLICLLVGIVLLCLALQQRAQWQSSCQTQDVVVRVGDAHYQISASQADTLALLSALRFSEGEEQAREIVNAHLEQGLAQLFADLARRLPAFADWYYSLGGEYSRLSMLVLEKVSLADEGYVARKAEELIFDAADFSGRLDILRYQADARLLRQAHVTRDTWLTEMLALLEQDRMPVAPLPQSQPLALDELLDQLTGYGSPEFVARLSVSSAAAVGVAVGPMIWRAASRRATAASGRAVAARGAGRGAARAGTAAAGGATLCAPSGPGALACALVAGAAGWLATDWALLRLDEALNRDELLAALQQSLDEMEDEMTRSLMAAYDRVLTEQYGSMQTDIQRTFRPLQGQRDGPRD